MRKTAVKPHHSVQAGVLRDFARVAALVNDATIRNSMPVEMPWLICCRIEPEMPAGSARRCPACEAMWLTRSRPRVLPVRLHQAHQPP